jgi:hypothetical protein
MKDITELTPEEKAIVDEVWASEKEIKVFMRQMGCGMATPETLDIESQPLDELAGKYNVSVADLPNVPEMIVAKHRAAYDWFVENVKFAIRAATDDVGWPMEKEDLQDVVDEHLNP